MRWGDVTPPHEAAGRSSVWATQSEARYVLVQLSHIRKHQQHHSDPTFRTLHSCSKKKSSCITEEDSNPLHRSLPFRENLQERSYFDMYVIVDLLNCCVVLCFICFFHVVWTLSCDRLWSFLTYETIKSPANAQTNNNDKEKTVSTTQTVIWINISSSHTFSLTRAGKMFCCSTI